MLKFCLGLGQLRAHHGAGFLFLLQAGSAVLKLHLDVGDLDCQAVPRLKEKTHLINPY